ncbi:MAG: sulfite exporter TauE/SafE family protein [Acidimicrobiales bacterium]
MLEALELTAAEAAFGASVVLVAGFIRGLTGFALSAVFVAGMSFVLDPIEAVPMALSLGVIASVLQTRAVFEGVDWHRVAILLGAAVIGVPIGVVILTATEPDVLRIVLFSVLLVSSLGLLRTNSGEILPTDRLMFGIGVLAGVVNGATALSGLVLVLAMSYLAISPREMRSTLIVYFFFSNLAVLLVLAASGNIDGTLWIRTLWALPPLALGIWVGSRAFGLTTPEIYRRITLGLLIAISAVGVVRILAS